MQITKEQYYYIKEHIDFTKPIHISDYIDMCKDLEFDYSSIENQEWINHLGDIKLAYDEFEKNILDLSYMQDNLYTKSGFKARLISSFIGKEKTQYVVAVMMPENYEKILTYNSDGTFTNKNTRDKWDLMIKETRTLIKQVTYYDYKNDNMYLEYQEEVEVDNSFFDKFKGAENVFAN